jgi:hypothetical protein
VNPQEACVEWVRTLRAVAAGEISPAEALGMTPDVGDDRSVPSAFWSARILLEQEVEFGLDDEEAKAYFASEMRKLADRIEQHEMLRRS